MSQHSFLPGTKADLQRSLDDLSRQMQEEEAKAKAASLNLPYIDLHNFPIDLVVLGLFTKEEATTAGAEPFYKDTKDLRIGTVEPHNPWLLEKIKEFSAHSKVTLYFISKKSLEQTLRFYSKVLRPKAAADETVRIEKEENYSDMLKALQPEAAQEKQTASRLLEVMFGASIFFKSSDIHLEPEEHFVKLRFRIDGVLQDILHLSKNLQRTLVTRIKVLSKLKFNVENMPQDGRLTFYYLDKPIDVRVSILPSAYCE